MGNPTEFSSLSIENSTSLGWRKRDTKDGDGKKSTVTAFSFFSSNRVSSSRLGIRFVSAVQGTDKEEPARNVEKREKKFSRRTGIGLELFSGRWTIFQVSDYVSWPQLRLITARAELVSFIGARARWMERYRHFERIEIGRRSISSWISAEEKEEGPLVRIIPNRLCLLSFADSPDFLPIYSPSRVRFQLLRQLGVVGRPSLGQQAMIIPRSFIEFYFPVN